MPYLFRVIRNFLVRNLAGVPIALSVEEKKPVAENVD